MSKAHLFLAAKLFLFTVLFLSFCAFQTSVWPFWLGSFPPPQLWLILIIFIAMKWPTPITLFYIYFLGLLMTGFTPAPLKTLWLSLAAVYFFVIFFKQRIHSNSLFYFSILVSGTALFYNIVFISISHWLEPAGTPIFILHRLLETGCNFLVSIPAYKLLSFFDQLLQSQPSWNAPSSATQNHDSNPIDF